MDQTKAIIFIIIGCGAVIAAFAPVQWYYSNDLIGSSQSSQKMPKWLARLICFFVAAMFLMIGISYFFGR